MPPSTRQHGKTSRTQVRRKGATIIIPPARVFKRSSHLVDGVEDTFPSPSKRPRVSDVADSPAPVPYPVASSTSEALPVPPLVPPLHSTDNATTYPYPTTSGDNATTYPTTSGNKGLNPITSKTRTRRSGKASLAQNIAALKEAIRLPLSEHLSLPHNDKGPIPEKNRTLAMFLRWKTLYNDNMVERVINARSVFCAKCSQTVELCNTMAYDWHKWGKHRERHTRDMKAATKAREPVRLDQLLNDCVRKSASKNWAVWTLFVSDNTQSADPQERTSTTVSEETSSEESSALMSPETQSRSSSLGSDERLMILVTQAGQSRRSDEHSTSPPLGSFPVRSSSSPCPWSESAESQRMLLNINFHLSPGLSGLEILGKAAQFMEHHNVLCECEVFATQV